MQTVTNAQQRYLDAFAALYEAAGELNAGDPMSYARSREIHDGVSTGTFSC